MTKQITITRKKIKNLNIHIKPDTSIHVSAPMRMSDDNINKFISSKIDWINKHIAKFDKRKPIIELEYISGETHYYFGDKYILDVIYLAGKSYIEITDDKYIELYIYEDSTKEMRQKMLENWYRANLKKQIPALIEKWQSIMNVSVLEWNVKKMKTRWGTCNPVAKRIWINLELAKKSPGCLEYIVVHEMTHLLEKKHNDIFKAYMDRFLPNWREIKKELNSTMI